MGLKGELFFTVFFVGLVGIAIGSWILLREVRSSVLTQCGNQLISIRAGKSEALQAYYGTLENEAKLLAGSELVLDASKSFIRGIDELNSMELDPGVSQEVEKYYKNTWVPLLNSLKKEENNYADFLPNSKSETMLQYEYITRCQYGDKDRILLESGEKQNLYNKAHAQFHPKFRDFIKTYGFYDLCLVNAVSGQIIYTTDKEIDFGSNLYSGPFKNSHLAQVVKASVTNKSSSVVFSDFDFYKPSLDEPAAFLAVPVEESGKIITILVLQISSQSIDDIMTSNKQWGKIGLGSTGEVILVGRDFLLRSNSRFFIEDRKKYFDDLLRTNFPESTIRRMETNDSSILLQSVQTQATRNAFAENPGVSMLEDYRKIPVIAAYQKVMLGGHDYAVVAKMNQNEAFKIHSVMENTLLFIIFITCAVVLMLASFLTNHYLIKPISALLMAANKTAEGDYSTILRARRNDELGALAEAFNRMCAKIKTSTQAIEDKNRENEALLLNILPAPIAERLKGGSTNIADSFPDVTVLFADIVGFTHLSETLEAQVLVKLLNELFLDFDNAALVNQIEKIKTIGDSYMAVCGMPNAREDHAIRMMHMAVRMLNISREFSLKHNLDIKLRIGIHTGKVVAGVMGKSRFIYDVWGDTVNMASRMESEGIVDAIQVTNEVYQKVKSIFPFVSRGNINVPGKGSYEVWLFKK